MLSLKNLPPNFDKGHSKICQKFHPFCKLWSEVSETQQIFNEFFKSVEPNFAKIFEYFTELNKKL
jgi:hypothetical protein